MKLKKLIGLGCFALTLSSLIVSCGNKEGDTPVTPDEPDTTTGLIKEATTITFSTTAGKTSQVALNKFIENFKEIEPNVTVNLDIVSGSYSTIASNIVTGFTANNYADMAMVYPDAVANFIDYGKCYNLEPFINNEEYGWSEEDKNDIVDAFYEEGTKYTIDGVYSLPFSKSSECVYYNKDAILGLTLDGVNNGNGITESYLNNLTWEEFFDVLCPALIQYNTDQVDLGNAPLIDTSGDYYAVMSYDSDANLFITLAEQYGYDYTSIENGEGQIKFVNDGMKELVTKFRGYADKHYIQSQISTGDTYSNTFFGAKQTLFAVGSTAGASYQFNAAGGNIGVFKIPQAKGKDEKIILQGPSMAFLKHTKSDGTIDTNRQLASWLFYKFMLEEDNALEWSETANYMPVRKSAYTSEEYLTTYDEASAAPNSLDLLTARIANYVSTLTDIYYTSPAFKGSSETRDAVGDLMGGALLLNSDRKEIDTLFSDAYAASIKAL